jgi:hypothetical protein
MGDPQRFVGIGHRFLGAGQGGHVELRRQMTCGGFVTHVLQQFGRRTDEEDALASAGAGERGVFRKKAIARMDQRHALRLRQRDDALDVEIRADRTFFPVQAIGFIGFETMDREAVFLGIDGNRAQTQFIGRAEDADRDFAAVGGQQFVRSGKAFGH